MTVAVKGLWIITEDFNEIVSNSEKRGRNDSFVSTGFGNQIEKNAMFDLGFRGQDFTWVKGTDTPFAIKFDQIERFVMQIGTFYSPRPLFLICLGGILIIVLLSFPTRAITFLRTWPSPFLFKLCGLKIWISKM